MWQQNCLPSIVGRDTGSALEAGRGTNRAFREEEGAVMKFLRLVWSIVSMTDVVGSLLCGASVSVRAQTTSMGTITGLVTDQSNAVVPDATVAVRDTSTNEVRTITTNSAGRYVFVNLPPGTYDIIVTKSGFQKVSIPNNVIAHTLAF